MTTPLVHLDAHKARVKRERRGEENNKECVFMARERKREKWEEIGFDQDTNFRVLTKEATIKIKKMNKK